MNRFLRVGAVLILATITLFFSSCSKDKDPFNPADQLYKEVAAIDNYLESNSIAHIKDVSGIRIVPTSLGTQLPPQSLSTVNITYKGSLFPSNTVFEESVATGFLTGFIPGWQIAIRKLPVGSKATIYIPSYYAYGNTDSGEIPANSTLVFDVTVNSAIYSTVFTDRFKSDTSVIAEYLIGKGLNAIKDPSGIYYISEIEGSGTPPSWFDQVKLKYTFTLLSDDTKPVGTFERDVSDQFSSFVVEYLQGVQVALMKMKPGSKMKLFVPSGLAFGIETGKNNAGTVVIPANANLIIDLELFEVK
jgi:FKBP-type peptidyl-prolyl cis-trans isomerase